MLLTLSGRGRLSHPPNRSTIQSKKTPDLYTEEEEDTYIFFFRIKVRSLLRLSHKFKLLYNFNAKAYQMVINR